MERILPLETSYHDATDDLRTPCGFSIADIKALGDFPDYAAFSGVPLPKPYHEFNIKKALPRPYRPFRWPYHQTMSLAKMESDWWLELENTYEQRIKQRSRLLAKHGDAVLQTLPGSELACKELMEMILQFLCARYPHYFSLNISKTVLLNTILNTETDLKQTPPLHVILQNVPEDFAVMLRDETTGCYKFRAGVICSALGWDVGTKIGLQLHEIHAPVPDYKEKLQFSMDRYFAKKPTDKPIQRGSWGLEVDQPLFMPPGDSHGDYRGYQMPDLELSRCHLRVDWQTLRRLPLSGAIVFNFKALFTSLKELRDEPFVPGLLLKVLNDGGRNLMQYKNTWHTEHVVKPALQRFHEEQVEKGMVEEGWEPKTLDESPWFPAWEEKWHRQQGF
ncbi:oxidoreductase [Ascochyta rabiei]|uniref:Oxidoreductase n=2 Tax=Didymella rabiei TaxID=5454 RepID=A0A163C8E1_DIDRA|nr:oxidoreductase [Ascochyta rabiei]